MKKNIVVEWTIMLLLTDLFWQVVFQCCFWKQILNVKIILFFYPHSSQMKNRPLIYICMAQFSQNMFCCVISIFVSVQCVFSLSLFLTPFTVYPRSFKNSKKQVWISWIIFFFFCHLKSSVSLNPNNLLSLWVVFLENEKRCHTYTF